MKSAGGGLVFSILLNALRKQDGREFRATKCLYVAEDQCMYVKLKGGGYEASSRDSTSHTSQVATEGQD